VVAELDYAINKDITLAGSIEYDRQWSNFAANNYTNVTVLAAITFGHKYDLPPKKKQTTEWRKIP
jgi:long-subunit fatty acid transport protein